VAKFTFGKTVDIHWNGYEIVGPALTVFSIPDQLYEEFEGDFRDVEPSLTWTDTNEFATLSNSVSVTTLTGSIPISVTSTTSGKIVSISSSTNPAGYYLRADGAGATTWAALPADATGITSVIGTSPISAAVVGTTATISLNANYQTSGTYVTGVVGTSPVSASGTTAITVSIDPSILTAENAARMRTYVRNTTASTITKGSVVYLDGSNGTVPSIQNALANADATSARTFGIVEADITSNSNGYVTNQGLLSPLDTSGVADGAILWLSPTVAGAFTTTKPSGPNHGVLVGIVVKGSSVGAGSIYVLIKNGAELDEIHDVNISSLVNGQALIWSSSASVWQNQALPVSAVIGTSPASVSTASGTSTVSIVAGSINSTHLSATSVGSTQLINQSVTTGKIGSGSATSGQLLRADGSGNASFSTVSSGSTINIEVITSSGTWVRPSNCRVILHAISVDGGSGGGNFARTLNATTFSNHYSGSPNTGSNIKSFRHILIGTETSIAVGIGAGGAGRSAFTITKAATIATTFQSGSQTAVSGGETTFGSYLSASTTNQSYVPAAGGKGGEPGITTYYISPTVSSAFDLYTYYGALPEATSAGGSGSVGTVTGTAGTVRVGAAGGAGGAAGKITGGGGGSGVLGTTLAADSGSQYMMSGGAGAIGGGGGGGGSVGVIFSGTQSATLTGGSAGNGSFYGAGGGEAGMVGVLASSSANYTASSFTINVQKGGDGYQGVLILVYLT